MQKTLFSILILLNGVFANAQTTITVMDNIVFFDGYQPIVVTDPAPPVGVIRHRNDLSAIKLTSDQLSLIGTTLQLNILIKALCDNYDRLGYVNLAMVPSGSETYVLGDVDRIQIARFITPFMNKNASRDSVPYTFNIDNIASILKDPAYSNKYDFWIELEVFGVPYAAHNEIAGCSGRNDVFMGKVELVTNSPAPEQKGVVLMPLFTKVNFNNYQNGATDVVGETIKTLTFNVTEDIANTSLYLITSNHGASLGGEEYIRRLHYVDFDGEEVLNYKPGRLTCEPFRKYNTQGNGIYLGTPRSPASWQSFSNWCPGDKIDIRKIDVGLVRAGEHTFKIEVPNAIFKDGKGNFPLSLYLQGVKSDPLSNNDFELENTFSIYPNPSKGDFVIEILSGRAEVVITDISGKEVLKKQVNQNVENFIIETNGVYFVTITSQKGRVTKKLVVN